MSMERVSDTAGDALSPARISRGSTGSAPTATDRAVRRLIVMVNDDEVIVKGVRAVLSSYADDVEVVGDRLRDDNLVDAATELGADILLLDTTGAPGMRGLGVVGEVLATSPPFRVVILTNDTDERSVLDAVRLGVSGYLLKSMTGAALADHLLRVGRGEMVLDPALAARIALRAAHETDGHRRWPGSGVGLSQRESDVLVLLTEALTNRAIAERLCVGEETVKTHLRSIYRKLDVTDRAQAISVALRQGVLH